MTRERPPACDRVWRKQQLEDDVIAAQGVEAILQMRLVDAGHRSRKELQHFHAVLTRIFKGFISTLATTEVTTPRSSAIRGCWRADY